MDAAEWTGHLNGLISYISEKSQKQRQVVRPKKTYRKLEGKREKHSIRLKYYLQEWREIKHYLLYLKGQSSIVSI